MNSDANLTRLLYVEEDTFATENSPTPTLQAIPFVSESLEATKLTEVSAEIRRSRGKRDLIKLGWSNAGPTNHEFAVGPYNDWILAALQSSGWTTGSIQIRGDISGNNTFTANASVAAALTTALSGSNNDLVFTAVTAGVAGNSITISYVDPTGNNVPLSVAVVGTAITFTLATDGSSAITSTADDIKALILATPAVSALITAADAGGDDGSGVVTALAATALTGGDGGAFPTAAQSAKYFRISGASTNNNGVKRIVSVNGSTLVVDAAGFGTNENDVTVTFFWNYAQNGSTFRSFGIEKQFLGLTTPNYQYYKGNVINEWAVTNAARARILQTFSWMGADMAEDDATFGDGSPTTESTREICTTSENIGAIYFGGSIRADVASLNFTLNNGLRERPVLGSEITTEHGAGYCEVTGTMEIYFNDNALMAAFLAHDEDTLLVPYIDIDGNVLSLYLPRIKSGNSQTLIEGVNTDVMEPYEFEALEELTTGLVVQVDQVNASA